jgi:gluconokinase
MKLVVGVDVGTTSAKATVFDADGGEHGSGEAGYELIEPVAGEVVQDPFAVMDATAAAIRAALDGHHRVTGLAFSSAMHSLVGLDEHDEPITPLLTWADNRAAEQADRLRKEHPELHARTGTPLHPMAPLAKLLWFRETRSELFARVRRWVGIKELIVHRLTGDWVIDVSCATGTGLLSLERLDWDPEALAIAGVRPEQLSRIVSVKQTLELGHDGLGLALGTPIVIGAGDGPLASLGVGAVRPGVAACSIGTSGALRLMVERPTIDPAHRLFCYALTPGRWALGGAINNGGSVLDWAAATLVPDPGPSAKDELLELAAGAPPGSDGLIMLPYLLSERAPHWDSLARGAYIGLRHFHTRAHLTRSAIEGVCQQLALVLASMREAGNAVNEIRATGGFARSPLWRQILTDALGMPIAFAAGHGGSGFGAALVGMEALGVIDSIDRAVDLARIEETLHPEPQAAATYAELRPLFADLYYDLTPAFRALARADHRQAESRARQH